MKRRTKKIILIGAIVVSVFTASNINNKYGKIVCATSAEYYEKKEAIYELYAAKMRIAEIKYYNGMDVNDSYKKEQARRTKILNELKKLDEQREKQYKRLVIKKDVKSIWHQLREKILESIRP